MTGKRNSMKRYELKTNKTARLTTKEKAGLDVMTDVDIDYQTAVNRILREYMREYRNAG